MIGVTDYHTLTRQMYGYAALLSRRIGQDGGVTQGYGEPLLRVTIALIDLETDRPSFPEARRRLERLAYHLIRPTVGPTEQAAYALVKEAYDITGKEIYLIAQGEDCPKAIGDLAPHYPGPF
jgi:hypothetical protein